MFIREKKTKTTTVLQLVENRRRGNGKVRQEIIVSLGGAAIPDQYRREVAVEVKNRLMGYQRLVPLEYEVGKWVDHILKKIDIEGKLPPVPCKEIQQDGRTRVDGVCIDEIDHERETELGPALALDAAWRSLQLDIFLKEAEFTDRQINSAKINIFNRLLEPCSENDSTIIVPASDGIVRHTRKPGRPDERQKLIYDILGVDLSNLPVKRNLYKDVKKK
jgi:hypothetical protein